MRGPLPPLLCSLLALVLAPGLGRASLVDYSNREINVKVVAFGPDLAACAATVDYLAAHAKQKTSTVTRPLRSGATLRTFTLVPRDDRGQPYRYRRFSVRLWIHTLSGPVTAGDLELLFKGTDAVILIQPAGGAAATRRQARQTMERLLRKFKRLKAPVVRHLFWAARPVREGATVKPAPATSRDPGAFASVRRLMTALLAEFSGKKRAP